jgi:hypothetical protein
MIKKLLTIIRSYLQSRKVKKRLEKMRKMDPFIYD